MINPKVVDLIAETSNTCRDAIKLIGAVDGPSVLYFEENPDPDNWMMVSINKKTGEVLVEGQNACLLCDHAETCDKTMKLDCWIPCG